MVFFSTLQFGDLIQGSATILAAIIATKIAIRHFEAQQKITSYEGTLQGILRLDESIFNLTKYNRLIYFFKIGQEKDPAITHPSAGTEFENDPAFKGNFCSYLNEFEKFAIGYLKYFDQEFAYDYFHYTFSDVWRKVLPGVQSLRLSEENPDLYRDVEEMFESFEEIEEKRKKIEEKKRKKKKINTKRENAK